MIFFFSLFIVPSFSEYFALLLNDLHMHATYRNSFQRLAWLCREGVHSMHGLKFIVLNGDLVDSGSPLFSLQGPGQREEEWLMLQEALDGCVKKIPVLPVRGNHDCFDVMGYDHKTNEFYLRFRKWLDTENKKKGVEISRFSPSLGSVGKGSYSVNWGADLDFQTSLLLDNCLAGLNRHFFAKYPTDLDAWVKEEISRSKGNVTVFTHFPTGTFYPTDRNRLISTLLQNHKKISGIHSGHIHWMYGFRAQTLLGELMGERNIREHELVDFAGTGYVRIMGLKSGLLLDGSVKDEKFPIIANARYDCSYAAVFDKDSMKEVLGISSAGKDELLTPLGNGWHKTCSESLVIEAHGKKVSIVNDRYLTGILRWGFLHIYEFYAILTLIMYILMVRVLYGFYQRSQDLVDKFVVILGIVFPILPWAVGFGWEDRICICGVWGMIDIQTLEWRPMDLNTLQMLPLMLRVIVKVGALSFKKGSVMQVFCSILLVATTLLGVKLLVLTYGPFLLLSPLFVWECICWGIKAKTYLTVKYKKE